MDAPRLAADIGGTFTDVVLEHGPQRWSCKVLTTPRAPELGVLDGVRRLFGQAGVAPATVGLFLHGTTLATNALIERKGARTALLTTEGFRDVLEMGYEKRFDQFDVQVERPPELVPRPLRFVARERVAADGSVLRPLDEAGVARAGQAMRQAGAQAVAIGFLHGWAHPAHERRARDILREVLPDDVTICVSSEVCPELREYERFSTTCANAYVRPLMSSYLGRLDEALRAMGMRCPLLLMMSGGGLTTLEHAARFPIRLVESGPAGGAILAARLAAECGLERVMAFDMGGTTAKVCLIADGRPERSRRFEIGRAWKNMKGSGLPVRVPVIELVEIGAGGGSIGRVDAMRRITVGPDSAGSEPGPACYGRGGTQPAVTDANLVLGRIDPERFAAGTIRLDRRRAEHALAQAVGEPLGMDAFWAAAGVSEIVEENMANAARVHAIERGQAIGGFTMVAFGGGAPLHAARLAQKLGIDRVVVPAGAGVGSAIGFLRAPVSFEVVGSDLARLDAGFDLAAANARLDAMRGQARAVVGPAAGGGPLQETALLELRYAGQGHELRVPLFDETRYDGDAAPRLRDADAVAIRERFEAQYERIYGLRIAGGAVELVTWSLTLSTVVPPPERATVPATDAIAAPFDRTDAWEPALGELASFARHRRDALAAGARVDGPALVVEAETTTIVPAGWTARLDSVGHLLLEAHR
jgi:N-methylhydantoinase A